MLTFLGLDYRNSSLVVLGNIILKKDDDNNNTKQKNFVNEVQNQHVLNRCTKFLVMIIDILRNMNRT